jgi:transcriptional regulator with XRE-family HTH domain
VTLTVMGRDLRARRRALGLTQAGLAAAVGARPVLVGRWERGEALPSLEEAARLAEVLGLDPATAAGWTAVARRTEAGPIPAPPPAEGAARPARARPRWLRRLSALVARHRASGTVPGEADDNAVFPSPRRRHSGEYYLDDPVEQRRYLWRWALTLIVLGALAVGLIWTLGELRSGWGAFLDLFRGRPPGAGLTRALPLLLGLALPA